MKEFNESKKADEILQDVKSLMNARSDDEKFHFLQKLMEEWKRLTCSERSGVGKQMENRTQSSKESDVKAAFGYNAATLRLDSLEFHKLETSSQDPKLSQEKRNHIVVIDPFKGCKLSTTEKSMED